MKTALILFLFSIVSVAQAANAETEKPNLPECDAIVSQCEAAGFHKGDHKVNGKGVWVDCVAAIAKGKAVTGVSATAEQAKMCQTARKTKRESRSAS